jgi:hypothetical protein
MSELKLGRATRPVNVDDFDSLYGARVEGLIFYERTLGGKVIELAKQPFGQPMPEGMSERRVAAVRIDDHDDKVYVLSYEVVPEHVRRTEALIASAREKLTEEEFNAVRAAKDVSWNV